HNVRVNMGAYGGTAEASRTPAGWGLLADVTNDGVVSAADLMFHAEEYSPPGSTLPRRQTLHSDFDRDGRITLADFAALAGQWLQMTQRP
ncbi:MAG: hypothetical protein IH624_20420, partial [Phycisphaerae bacterium]|nr:hypothetical protein [Phycisphaerae bacterium]